MCGIAGIINNKDIDLQKITALLKHRGPDEQTYHIDDNVSLIHTRLAIQDIHGGTQPFCYDNYYIIFNGEIYNHLKLRQHLKEFTFKTHSDTETLLFLYIKYKSKLFDMVDGMYAFCIYDKNNGQLILARDRAGKKPLYYYQDGASFIFASELNVIQSVKKLHISSDAINCYLRSGYIWRPYTAYTNVYKLEAASFLTLNVHTLQTQIRTYFDLLPYYQKSEYLSFTESLQQLETKLMQSISDRIMASDVEVGIFLSGGIDSGLITALTATMKKNVKTFTVKFEHDPTEAALAKLVAQKYNTTHTELNISQNINHQTVEKILLGYGEPFADSSAIPSYFVSQEARKHVKVILSGDGADELFSGYRRYIPSKYQFAQYLKLLCPLLTFIPKPQVKKSIYNYLHRSIAMANKQGLDFYLSATTDVFEDVYAFENSAITNQLQVFVSNILNNIHLSPLKKIMYLDFQVQLFCDLLVKMDIASMANSLEVRSPFLSKQLLEFAPGLPDHYKINRFKTKFILKKLAEKYLPPQLLKQPKRGFEVPLKKWVDGDLQTAITDLLNPGCYAEHFVKRPFIQDLLAKKMHVSAEKRAKMLWSLYCLEIWYKNQTV